MGHDPSAIDGKFKRADETAQLLIIGAGSAGTEAAIAAVQAGESVLLVDENPVDPQMMGLDAPLFYGGRMTSAIQRPERLLEQMLAANPRLGVALELGVDVRLGVTAWGLYVNGPNLRGLPQPMVGLADHGRSWMCGFERLILATGARDVALAFPGWDQPGVMGANGLNALVTRYDAFAGRRIVVMGSGELAVATARLALSYGLEVAALVEVLSKPQGSPDDLDGLAEAGVPLLLGCTQLSAVGGVEGVAGLALLDSAGIKRTLSCDTICQCMGLAPAIELLNAAGGDIVADAMRGGHAPRLDGIATSLAHVSAVGDCAGTQPGHDVWAYQAAWLRALAAHADPSMIVCQCEGVTRGDLLEVRAPRYLGDPTEKSRARQLKTLAADGPVNQDQIKRLTRACMGVCQARRCREQVALMLALETGVRQQDVPLAGFRAPVRPLPLRVLADFEESIAMRAGWEIWMAIPGQWAPYDAIGTDLEFEPVQEVR